MKKYIESMMLVFAALWAFTACSSSDADYQWATATGEQVYFSNTLPSQKDISFDASSFTVTLNRVKTDEAITVGLALDDTTNTFSIPASVTFAAGSNTADIVVSYDTEKLAYDQYVTMTLSIDEAHATPYGASAYTFKAGVPSPFKSLGKGHLTDNYYFEDETDVEIMQNENTPNVFRLVAPYSAFSGGGDAYMEITVLQPGDVVDGVTITNPDLIYFTDYNTGEHNSNYDADIYLLHVSNFKAGADESAWLYSRVLAYQEDGTPGQIQLAPYYYMFGVGGWNQSQTDGIIIINFPGYTPKDYALAVDYKGGFFDESGKNYASVDLTAGADITSVQLAVIEGSNVDAAFQGVIDGTIASETVSASDAYNLLNNYSGYCSVVAVGYDGEDAVATAYAKFYTEAGGPQWVSLGMGEYTEDCLLPNYIRGYASDPLTYSVEIQQNVANPGIYRMVDPYGSALPYNEAGDWDASKTWYVIVDATDPEAVFIPEQRTSLNWDDGEFSIQSLGSYYMDGGYPLATVKAAGYMGTLVDGVITFPEKGLLAIFGTSASYANTNSLTKIVLPSAVTAAAPRRAPMAYTSRQFAPVQQVSRVLLNRQAPISKEQMR